MKKLLILTNIFLVSCSSVSVESNYFHNEADALFKDYHYQVSYERKTSSFYVLDLQIDKKNIDLNDLKKIKAKMIQRGWVYNYDIDGYYWSYCKKDSNEAVGIYYTSPTVKKMRNGDYFSADHREDTVYVYMTNYYSDKDNQKYAECT